MITTERIAELRAIIAAASLMDEEVNMGIGKAVTQKEFYQSAKLALPSALDTIEAQQRRIEELEAALKPFAQAADTADKSDGEILKTSRGTLSDYRASYFGVIAQDFRAARAALQPKETK